MQQHRDRWRVTTMCRVLGVSRARYYQWARTPISAQAAADARLLPKIRTTFAELHRRCGSPRVHRELRAQGTRVSRKRVERLMRQEGLRAKRPRPFRVTTQSVDIAHLIQVALTPIFLISAIGVTLNVLTSRLARIVDRARAMEDRLLHPDYVQDGRDLHAQLKILARRSRWINAAIILITLSALFIALVVVMLFVNAFLRYELSAVIAGMFIMSMLTLAAALLAFLIEVRIATTTLRIGIIEASRPGG